MIKIAEEAIVSCYVDAASLLLMVLLTLLSLRLHWQKNAATRAFSLISLCVTLNCVMCFLTNAMYMQTAPWTHVLVRIARMIRELLVLAVNLFWLPYVYHKLYGDEVRHPLLALAALPWAVMAVLNLLNPFTGLLYSFSADNRFEPRPLLYACYVFGVVYFAASAVLVWHYDGKGKKLRLFHITPMIVPIVVTVGAQFFTQYDIGILGYAIGVATLQLSMVSEYRFLDGESGLYNPGYLAYLFDLALAGKYNACSALILEAEGDLSVCHSILRGTLHQDGDVIRAEPRKYVMFSRESSLSTNQYLASVVDEAAKQHNAENPDNKVRFTIRSRTRAENEDVFTFLRTVLKQEEGGAEMRGIVSMISELDRLDEELKLAADIQFHVLPMVFPPFPGRHEFELYASMDPAKEVGGDFYDFFLVDPDHLALVIADVSGKGIPAALFMMVSKALIKNQLMAGFSPAEALSNVNAQLCERNDSQMFVTVWAAVIELSTGRGTACNAGHENPGVRRSGGRYELLAYQHNMFLGIARKARYTDRPFEMQPGDSLFVYTDGVPEAQNDKREMFGSARLEAALNLDADAGPEALLGKVRQAVDAFVQDAPQFDDLTMLAFQYHGPQNESLEGGDSLWNR